MYEWLIGYQKLEQEIYYLDWELETYKAELDRWCDPSDLGRYSLTKDSKASKLEDIISDLERRLAFKINRKFDLEKIIYGFKGLDHHILRMKYVEGLSLKEISVELDHGYYYIRRRHAAILRELGHKEGTTALDKR